MNTTKITVQFTGTITYDAAPENCEGQPYPSTADGHAEAMAGDIVGALNEHLMFDEDNLEPTDYVQAIYALDVTGLTAAEIKRLADLEKMAVRARELVDAFQEKTSDFTDADGNVDPEAQGAYDAVSADHEFDAWPLVQLLASYAKSGN